MLLAHHSARHHASAHARGGPHAASAIEPFETTLLAQRPLPRRGVAVALAPAQRRASDTIDGRLRRSRETTPSASASSGSCATSPTTIAPDRPLQPPPLRRGARPRDGARAMRYGEGAAVLLIDIDDFKYVNDTHRPRRRRRAAAQPRGDDPAAHPRDRRARPRRRRRVRRCCSRARAPTRRAGSPRTSSQAGRDHVLALGGGLLHVTVSVGAVAFDATERRRRERPHRRRPRDVRGQGAGPRPLRRAAADVADGRRRAPQVPWEQRIRARARAPTASSCTASRSSGSATATVSPLRAAAAPARAGRQPHVSRARSSASPSGSA